MPGPTHPKINLPKTLSKNITTFPKPFTLNNKFLSHSVTSFFSKPSLLGKAKLSIYETSQLVNQGRALIDKGDTKSFQIFLDQFPKSLTTFHLLEHAESKKQYEMIKIIQKHGQLSVGINQKTVEERMSEQTEKNLQDLTDGNPGTSPAMTGRWF